MSTVSLLTTKGASLVTRDELLSVQAPEPTLSWFPLSHGQVLERVERQLAEAGFMVTESRYALSRGNARFFGVLGTTSSLGSGVTLAVGVRNSTDKSLPIGFVAGHHVMVCDNMAFRSEILVVRKHTKNGELRFAEAMARAILQLTQFKDEEARRIQRLRETVIGGEARDSIILNAFSEGIISSRQLVPVIQQARFPKFDYGADADSAWTLMQAFTWVLADVMKQNPQRFAAATMRLQHLLDQRLPPAP